MIKNVQGPAGRWPRNRWQAGLTHLLLSMLVAGGVFLLIRLVWYPNILFTISGGSELALLVIGIDVVLGPVLTTVVFLRGKKRLWLDLAIIGLLQASAFLYGAYVVWVARPVFMVAAIDRVQVIGMNEIEPANWAGASESARVSSWGPVWVGVEMPTDPALREDLMFGRIGGGVDLPLLPRFYQKFDSVKSALYTHGLPINALPEPERDALLRELADNGLAGAGLVWVPLVGRIGSAIMVLDRQGNPVRAFQADPWNRRSNKSHDTNEMDRGESASARGTKAAYPNRAGIPYPRTVRVVSEQSNHIRS
jgi:hypothetical protein